MSNHQLRVTPTEKNMLKILNDYFKHAVSVAVGIAVSIGVLDPATGTLHVSSTHAVYLIIIGTATSLLMSYAGLGAPSAPRKVYVQTEPAPTQPVASTPVTAPPANVYNGVVPTFPEGPPTNFTPLPSPSPDDSGITG